MTAERWQLPAETASAARARSMVRQFLAGSGASQVDEPVAMLAVSELVTNAVLHSSGDSPLVLSVELRGGHLRIDVEDVGAGPPRLDHPGDEAEHGRGLHIVDQITDAWGWSTAEDDTKHVWCDVPSRAQDADG
jgi:anti-sigma regulatory factor (Ser/Thr protein kinase)